VLAADLGARALTRGSHLEDYEQRNDYIKAGSAGKKDVQCT